MPAEYELQRERNIAANRKRMRELGVGLGPPRAPSKTATTTNEQQRSKKKPPDSSEAPRRTGRARTTVRSYSDEDMIAVERPAGGAAKAAMAAYEPEPTPADRRKSALSLPECLGNVTRHPTKGHLVFKDRPEFKPNLTPAQVIRAGSWGGCYFNPIGGKPGVRGPCAIDPKEHPEEWFDDLDVQTFASRRYNCQTNMYGVKAGQDQVYWEEHGWIDERDPRGWFQWYCRFYCGRRMDDDDRQIGRWKGVCGEKGRWKNNLINKILNAGASFDDSRISPVVRQTCLHWAVEVTEGDVLAAAKKRRR